MKLCRFDLASAPGTARSGIVHGGKVYETEGTQPVAVHDWSEARLLAPIGRPPSIRLFTGAMPVFMEQMLADAANQSDVPRYIYLNSGLMQGPQSIAPESPISSQIALKVCLAAVIGEGALHLDPEDAEKLVIGYTLAGVLFAADLERNEIASGIGIVRSHEVGVFVGPALTTLDELEEAVLPGEGPVRYKLDVAVSLDGEEVLRLSSEDVPFAFGDLASFASQTAPLQAGDLILLNLGSTAPTSLMIPGAQARLISDRLGTLAFRYG